jgi:hypothetical protein
VLPASCRVSCASAIGRKRPHLRQRRSAVPSIYEEQFGPGPTQTRTTWAEPDILLVMLESLTTAELRAFVSGIDTRTNLLASCSCCPQGGFAGSSRADLSAKVGRAPTRAFVTAGGSQ